MNDRQGENSTTATECPNCKGLGMAWYWRTYGDRQYHGEYFEKCETCYGKKVVDHDGR
jgi:hypothetical protein